MKIHYSLRFFLLQTSTALALFSNQATAGTTFNGNAAATTGNWDAAANWEGTLPTFNATTDLLFRNITATNRTTSLIASAKTVRSLTFNGNVTAGFEIRLTNGTNGAAMNLTMGDASNAAAITVNSDAAGNITIGKGSGTTGNDGNLILANNLAVAQNSANATLIIDRPITGAFALTKSGAGTLKLSGTNTYTGVTNINNGTLQLDGSTSASSTVGIGTAGILSGIGTVNGSATLTGGGIINKSAGSIAGTLGVTGGNWNGSGTVTGAVTSSSGTFTIGSGANLTSTAGVAATGGALVVNGTLTGALSTNSSTTVSGTGTITGNTTISGIHSPGNSPGVQSYGSNLSYVGGSSVTWELGVDGLGTRGTDFDGINVGGILDFSGATTVNLAFNFAGSTVDWTDAFWDTSRTGTSGWLVYDVAGTTTNFSNLSVTAANWLDGSGGNFDTSNLGNTFSLYQDGSDIYLNYNVVPEPNVAALLGGLGTLILLRRRR
jgi:autotransporter-associated beta strand protein